MATLEQETDYPGLAAATVCGAFQATAAARADVVALRTRGNEITITWAEYAQRVEALAAGLAGLGIGHGDTVGTMLTNRPEFHIVDMAAVHLGAVPFGMYNTSPAEDIQHRLRNADARVVVTQLSFLPALQAALVDFEGIDHVVVVDGPAEGALSLADVVAAPAPDFDFAVTWQAVRPEDLVTIIYTSGTTGPPKGAQWSHANVMAQLNGVSQIHPLPTRVISYLPFAHAGERMMSHYMSLGRGATITSCEDYRTVLLDVMEVHPDVFMSVPRMWVKLKGAIKSDIDSMEDTALRDELLRTLEVGERRVQLTQAREAVPQDVIEEHERGLAKLRANTLPKYGLDAVEFAVIGSAPPPPDVCHFFLAIGVPLVEAYGMTESSFVATVPRSIGEYRIGSTGVPIPGLELKLADDGEILLRGATVMAGYRKQPDATAEAIDADGWLYTGDIGELDDEGNLKVVDRKKQLIINYTGKNMSPAVIERAILSETSLISYVVALGDGRPYVVALVTLDPNELAVFASKYGLTFTSTEDAVRSPEVIAEIAGAIERGNAKLSRPEQIKRHVLLPVEWFPDSEELTPTAKVKRRDVQQKYAVEIEELYREA